MADPYPTDGVQPYHNLWYTFWDGFLQFNTWLAKWVLEKQKDLILLKAFKGWQCGVPSALGVNFHSCFQRSDRDLRGCGKLDAVAYCWGRGSTSLSVDIGGACHIGQIVPEVDGLLDDYNNFNFHAYKVMARTFAPPEVSLFDKTLLAVLGSQIMDSTTRDSNLLEMLVVITPSMLPCITWRGTWSLKCYCSKRVARQFGYDKDIPPTSSLDNIDWNKVMQPYIDEAATTMWSEGVATLRFFSTAKISTMSPLMLEYWGTLLKRFEAFIQSLQKVVEYDPAS
ncbi:hypothetical protein SLEP1_g27702 [Rubroshorea leprosula]|uniref:Uncharacterized protein n=1 Tax=Rubroshorea leprosula TaxID=152421 RepID=A0AAV5JWU2_9ROSI|nr:hypothetical protein SLEP1_g27702 [Rubroshorea leprosula]